MRPLRVFISHSTHNRTSDRYLQAVIRAIEARKPDLEVLVDKLGIKSGDDWRPELYSLLDEAHAAVVLLSDDAQNSKWVGIEISILRFLHFRGKHGEHPKGSFLLLPVDLAEVPHPEALSATLRFEDIQYVAGAKPEIVAQRVVDRLSEFAAERQKSSPPPDVRERYISDCLRKDPVGLDDLVNEPELGDALRGQLARSGLDDAFVEQVLAAHRPSVAVAKALVRMTFDGVCSFIEELSEYLNGVRGDDHRDAMLKVLAILDSSWVDEGDALFVAQRANDAPSNRSLSVCSSDRWIIECLIKRSRGRPLAIDVKVVYLTPPRTEKDWDDVLPEVKKQIYDKFRTPKMPDADQVGPAEIDRFLSDQLAELRKPVFIVFPESWLPDRDQIRQLRGQLKQPTLVIAGNPVLAAGLDPPAAGLPHLDADTAKRTAKRFARAWNDVNP